MILAVILARMVSEDGESNWLEGAMLLMIYAILATAFFFLPKEYRAIERDKAASAMGSRDGVVEVVLMKS